MLLAAGRSRRMGAFKPLLPWGGKTVVESCVGNLRAGGAGTVVVVIGHRAEEVRARLAGGSVQFAVNDEPDSEMTASISRGVGQLPPEAEIILVALCDQPAIPAEVVRHLIDEKGRIGAPLVVPEHGGRGGHPVLLDADFRAELLRLDAQRGLRALFDAHRELVRRVPVASPYVTRDVDTWDEYRSLHEEVFGITPPPRPLM